MHTRRLRPTNTNNSDRTMANKARRLRRNEIRFLVDHCLGLVPSPHITAGLLNLLGCWTTVRVVERDYRALGLTPA